MEDVRFIAVQGPDGAGKTVVSRALSDRLGFEYFKSPAAAYRGVREYFDRHATPLARFFFYIASNCDASAEIEEILKVKRGVVVDRWTEDTRAYHEVLIGRSLSGYVDGFGILRPDATIILTADWQILKHRRQNRLQQPDSNLEKNDALMAKVVDRFREITGPRVMNLDTSKIGEQEVIQRCLDYVVKSQQLVHR